MLIFKKTAVSGFGDLS